LTKSHVFQCSDGPGWIFLGLQIYWYLPTFFSTNFGSYFPLIICQMSSICNCRQGMAIGSLPKMTIYYWNTTIFTHPKV
jgi:hypothetical protein